MDPADMNALKRLFLVVLLACGVPAGSLASGGQPVPVILDTDMGNDIDDVFALGVLHALASRGECRIAAVTVSKDHPLSAPWVDVLNTFHERPGTPIGVLRTGKASGSTTRR
jgi:hypothetical protein